MELKAAEVLLRRRIGRLAEEGRKVPHIANVIPLGVFAEPARPHVVDHALPQRADGLVRHRKLLSRMGLNPMILRQGRAFAFLVSPSVHPAVPRRPTARAVSFLGGLLPCGGGAAVDRYAQIT